MLGGLLSMRCAFLRVPVAFGKSITVTRSRSSECRVDTAARIARPAQLRGLPKLWVVNRKVHIAKCASETRDRVQLAFGRRTYPDRASARLTAATLHAGTNAADRKRYERR